MTASEWWDTLSIGDKAIHGEVAAKRYGGRPALDTDDPKWWWDARFLGLLYENQLAVTKYFNNKGHISVGGGSIDPFGGVEGVGSHIIDMFDEDIPQLADYLLEIGHPIVQIWDWWERLDADEADTIMINAAVRYGGWPPKHAKALKNKANKAWKYLPPEIREFLGKYYQGEVLSGDIGETTTMASVGVGTVKALGGMLKPKKPKKKRYGTPC